MDAVIQLPGHPLRCLTICQHGVGQPDQIIIIQKATAGFQTFIFGLKRPAKTIERRRQVTAPLRRAGSDQLRQSLLRRLLHLDDTRKRRADILVRQTALGQRAIAAEQRLVQTVDICPPPRRILAKPGCEFRGPLLVTGNAACRQHLGGGAKPLYIKLGYQRINHPVQVQRRVDAARLGKMRLKPAFNIRIGKPGLLVQKLVKKGFRIAFACLCRKTADQPCQIRIGAPQQNVARFRLHPALFEGVGEFRLWHDAGLDREPAQHRLAEGMHRLHARPVIIVENFGEQAARPCQHVLRGNSDAHPPQIVKQCFCGTHRPVRQLAGNAVAHLRRRRAGIGDTQDAVGRRPLQHQAQHPIRQKLGLAGAGIRRDKDRGCRIGRRRLPP